MRRSKIKTTVGTISKRYQYLSAELSRELTFKMTQT